MDSNSRERPVLEASQKGAGVVDAYGFHFACQIVFAFFDKGFRHRRHTVNATVQPDRRVDAMGQQVSGHPAARGSHIQPPEPGAALRQIG